MKKIFTVLLLIMAVTLGLCACAKKPAADEIDPEKTLSLGEGKTTFILSVTDGNDETITYEVHTDKENVGDALLEYGVVEGDKGEFGLYVTSVTGIAADYDKDKTYWAFYADGELAPAAVDMTPIKEDVHYSLKLTK